MMPDNKLSTVTVKYLWKGLDTQDPSLLEDYEEGGIAISDPSAGLQYQLWHYYASGKSVYVEASNSNGPIHLFDAATDVKDIAGAFDQNMNTFVAFLDSAQWHFRWFDTSTNQMVTSDLPVGVTSCRCTLDEKRSRESSISDILLFYTLDNNLYMRMQRDRYTVEYLLREGIGGELVKVGMNGINRMQIKLRAIL